MAQIKQQIVNFILKVCKPFFIRSTIFGGSKYRGYPFSAECQASLTSVTNHSMDFNMFSSRRFLLRPSQQKGGTNDRKQSKILRNRAKHTFIACVYSYCMFCNFTGHLFYSQINPLLCRHPVGRIIFLNQISVRIPAISIGILPTLKHSRIDPAQLPPIQHGTNVIAAEGKIIR